MRHCRPPLPYRDPATRVLHTCHGCGEGRSDTVSLTCALSFSAQRRYSQSCRQQYVEKAAVLKYADIWFFGHVVYDQEESKRRVGGVFIPHPTRILSKQKTISCSAHRVVITNQQQWKGATRSVIKKVGELFKSL